MKVAFWRAVDSQDDRWAEHPALAGLSLEAHAKHELGDEVEFEYCATAQALADSDAELAAISAVTDVWPFALEAMELCKAAEKYVVLGGPHATHCTDSVPPEVDCIVVGEGEVAFANVLRARMRGQDVERIQSAPPLDLTQTTWLPLAGHNGEHSVVGVASRGCPYRCTFCTAAQMWGKVRRFSPEYTARWLREQSDAFTSIMFLDLTFFSDMPWLDAFADAAAGDVAAGLYRITAGSGRTNLITEALFPRLRRLGIAQIGVGMESCSPKILPKLKPKCRVEDHERAVRLCYENGIMLSASFIVGTPGETDEDLQATHDFIERWQGKYFKQAGLFLLTPYPDTHWWAFAQERGIVSDPPDWTKFHRGVGRWSFADCTYLNGETMPREECEAWRTRLSKVSGLRDPELTTPRGLVRT